MTTEDDDNGGHRPDRLWRVEQRQGEMISRLDRLQQRLDDIASHNWRLENSLIAISRQLDDLLKRSMGGMLGEMAPLVKMVLGALLAMIAALAFGKAFVWPG